MLQETINWYERHVSTAYAVEYTRAVVGEDADRILLDTIDSTEYYQHRLRRGDSLNQFLDLRSDQGALPMLPFGDTNFYPPFVFNGKNLVPMIKILSSLELMPEVAYWNQTFQIHSRNLKRRGELLWCLRERECLPDIYRVFRMRLSN